MKCADEDTSTTQRKNVSTYFLKFFTWLGIWQHHVTKLLSDECANKVITHVLLTFTGQTSTGWLGCELHCINRESFMNGLAKPFNLIMKFQSAMLVELPITLTIEKHSKSYQECKEFYVYYNFRLLNAYQNINTVDIYRTLWTPIQVTI